MMPFLFQETPKRAGKRLGKVFSILDALDECDDIHGLPSFV